MCIKRLSPCLVNRKVLNGEVLVDDDLAMKSHCPPESVLLWPGVLSLTSPCPPGDTRWRRQLGNLRKHCSSPLGQEVWALTSQQRKQSLSKIWLQPRKMRKRQLGTWEARHNVGKAALLKDRGGECRPVGGGQVHEFLSQSEPLTHFPGPPLPQL